MATLDDVANNQDMINIANAIRKVTRSTGKMTVLQMPERLAQIRVAEKREVSVNLNSNNRIVLSTYDTSIKHLFLVTPKTTDDASLFAKTAPELELQFNQETGELAMSYTPHEDAVNISMMLVDILLPDDETSTGFLVNVSSQDFVDLSSEQVITGRKIFNAEADFNNIVQHNADVHVNDAVIQLTHTQKDQVTKIGADEIIIKNGSGEQQVNYTVALPKKSGTMLVDKDLDNVAKKDSNNNFSTSQTVNGTLTVNGNIVQNGSSYETHAEQVFTKNDEIITREGAVGGLSAGQLTGIKATKYDGTNDGQLGFDANGVARVGDVNDTQPLLTRAESTDLTDGQLLKWDATKQRAVGSDSVEPVAEAIRDNIAQIVPANGGLAIGGSTKPTNSTSIVIGKRAIAGNSASPSVENSVVIGVDATGLKSENTTIGKATDNRGQNTVCVGFNTVANLGADNSVVVGSAITRADKSVVVGGGRALVQESGGVAIGYNTEVGSGIAVGQSTESNGNGVAIGNNVQASSNSVVIGSNLTVTDLSERPLRSVIISGDLDVTGKHNSVVIGSSASVGDAMINVAIGYSARANNGSIQLGSGENSTPSTLQISSDNIYDYDTHTLKVQNAQVNGNNVYGMLQGETDPTETTVGAVGQFYLNTASKALWQCVAITTTTDATTYTWQQVGGSKKYQHNIVISTNDWVYTFNFINTDNASYTSSKLVRQALYDLGFTTDNNALTCNAVTTNSGSYFGVMNQLTVSETYITAHGNQFKVVDGVISKTTASAAIPDNVSAKDTVIAL